MPFGSQASRFVPEPSRPAWARSIVLAPLAVRAFSVKSILSPHLADLELIEAVRVALPIPAQRPFIELVQALREWWKV